jgi:hypothetical protein
VLLRKIAEIYHLAEIIEKINVDLHVNYDEYDFFTLFSLSQIYSIQWLK